MNQEDLPKISIVTSSYNQGQFIEETIKSVLSQEGNFVIDYIIADGGSTDNSIKIIKKYDELLKTKKYPIKCNGIEYRWWSKPDKGQSDAINQGFKIAKGDILAWINSDDYYEPASFEFIIKKFKENPDVGLIYGDCYKIMESNSERIITKAKQGNFTKFLNTGRSFGQSSAFFTKKIFDKVSLLDENLHYAMDLDLWLRISKTSKILYVPRILSTYKFWSGCKSVIDENKFGLEIKKICEKYDKNFLSQRKILISLAQSNFRKYLKIKFPKFHQYCKNILYFFISRLNYQK